MIYLDSSALLKLLFEEAESDALEAWLTEQTAVPRLSSELVRVELVRATRRLEPRVVPTARSLVAQLDLVPITGPLLDAAADTGDPLLRNLDAIHLASAEAVRSDLTAFVAYDGRLTAAAESAGLPVVRPAA